MTMGMGTGLMTVKPLLPTIAAVQPNKAGKLNIDWHEPSLWDATLAAHKEGLSATQIMFRIHDTFTIPAYVSLTRNAVLGALHRKGIAASDRHFRPKRTPSDRVPDASKQRRATGRGGSRAARIVNGKTSVRNAILQEGKAGADAITALYGDASEVEPWDKLSIPFQPNGRTTIGINALNERTCKWPFDCDDGAVQYCGDHVRDGNAFPYCAVHTRLASGGMPQQARNPKPMYRGTFKGSR